MEVADEDMDRTPQEHFFVLFPQLDALIRFVGGDINSVPAMPKPPPSPPGRTGPGRARRRAAASSLPKRRQLRHWYERRFGKRVRTV